MIDKIFNISLSISAIIVMLLIITPFINKRYTARWRYFVWLILSIRLIIPLQIELPDAPVKIRVPEHNVTIQSDIIVSHVKIDSAEIKNVRNSVLQSAAAPAAKLKDVLTIAWAVGATAFFLFHIVVYLHFTGEIRKWSISTDIQSNPEVMVCRKILSPMLAGYFKPVILLPNLEYEDNDLSMILYHEQVHYRRGDLWYKLILILANSIHWFNPFVYLMVYLAGRDLEFSCDDIVIKNQNLEFRKKYSKIILNTAYQTGTTALSTYFNGGKKNMKQRLKNIFDTEARKRGTLAIALILIIAAMAGSLVACSSASATTQSEEVNKPEEVTLAGMPKGIKCIMAEKAPNAKLEKLIIDEFDIPDEYLKETRYYYNYVDLNNDGTEEIFAVVMGMYTSGTGGSSALLVNQDEKDLQVGQVFNLVHTPVIISNELTNGHRDIIAEYYGGGANPEERYRVLKYKDGIYPDVQDGTVIKSIDDVKGTAIICNDIEKEIKDGTALTLKK